MTMVSERASRSDGIHLVSAQARSGRSTVWVRDVPVGPGTVTVVAGPCAVETPEQALDAARMAKDGGATILRGGAFKPRTSPYSFQGLGEEGLKILADVAAETELPVVTEVLDPADLDLICSHADMLQIGARNAQNFPLLRAVGQTGHPVLLKRGMGATVREWLLAAEFIAAQGNLDIVLCERGIRTFEPSTRATLDISAVPVAQDCSHLPVIVDPSHAAGRRDLVLPLVRAALAAGADGVIVEVHPTPETALCDGPQALSPADMAGLDADIRRLAAITGRVIARGTDAYLVLESAAKSKSEHKRTT